MRSGSARRCSSKYSSSVGLATVRAVSDYVPTSADDSSQSSGGDPEYTEAAFSRLSL